MTVALTEVWWHSKDGEWVRTNVDEADAQFSYSVSSNSQIFRCYKCFQYVTFVKGTDLVSSHFKHSRGDTDKNCEDRSINLYATVSRQLPIAELPLRLVLDGGNATISVGFPPVVNDDLINMINRNCCLSISMQGYDSLKYKVDYSHFLPNTTNWFEVPLKWLKAFTISFSPNDSIPSLWQLPLPRILEIGALFDSRTGRRVAERGDVQVGRVYYLLQYRHCPLYGYGKDISIQPIIQDNYWTVYRLEAYRMSDSASAFFFDELHMRLTQHASDIDVMWPPVVQREDIIETQQRELMILVSGQQDMQTYPSSYSRISATFKLSPLLRVYKVLNNGSLQMVCAERFSQTLQCLYIRQPEKLLVAEPDAVAVTDDNNHPIVDTTLKKVPVNKTLRFLSPVDGSLTISDEVGFCYRKALPANVEIRITDLYPGCTITVRQALKEVFRIVIEKKRDAEIPVTVPQWRGRLIPIHSRHAAILNVLSPDTEIYQRVLESLRSGYIPEDGWQMLTGLMEE